METDQEVGRKQNMIFKHERNSILVLIKFSISPNQWL